MNEHTFTVYCKMPDDGRGEYSEEIDVRTKSRSRAAAMRAAQRMIDKEYDPALRPVRVVYRPLGWF